MKVSIIISNRNDLEMLSITVRSCIEELKPVGHENSEIIICDNSDRDKYNLLSSVIPNKYVREGLVKIIRQNFPCLFTAREEAIKNASGTYILCIDSHCLIGRNMFVDLFNFIRSKSSDETLGFCHAPINWSHQHESNSKHDRDMSTNELGDWHIKYDFPRTITWKGMPWICRREWFLNNLKGYGSLATNKLSWGGGDMHLGIKTWLLGYKNWAVPTSPCIHIGPFPKIDQTVNNKFSTQVGKYRLYSNSGNGPHTIGFLVSCYVLGGEPMMERNKVAITERFGNFINVEEQWNQAIAYGEVEKLWLDKNKVMTFEQLLETKPWDN